MSTISCWCAVTTHDEYTACILHRHSSTPKKQWTFSDTSYVVLTGLFLCTLWERCYIYFSFLIVRYAHTTSSFSQKSLELTKSWLIDNECWHVLVDINELLYVVVQLPWCEDSLHSIFCQHTCTIFVALRCSIQLRGRVLRTADIFLRCFSFVEVFFFRIRTYLRIYKKLNSTHFMLYRTIVHSFSYFLVSSIMYL